MRRAFASEKVREVALAPSSSPRTIGEITHAAGCSIHTVRGVIGELVAAGKVEQVGYVKTNGRPARLYSRRLFATAPYRPEENQQAPAPTPKPEPSWPKLRGILRRVFAKVIR